MPDRPRLFAVMLLGLAGCLPIAPARAGTLSLFDFAGACVDCTDTGAGELILNDYAIGTAIDRSNFVSFTYKGTNLLPGYTIGSVALNFISGQISEPLPGTETITLSSNDQYFSSSADGFWCTGGGCIADFGLHHVWSEAATSSSSVPEPMTLALLGGGLLGLAAFRTRS